jgi:hypothetical protein
VESVGAAGGLCCQWFWVSVFFFFFDVPRLVLTNPLSPIVVVDGDIDRTRDASILMPMPMRLFG